MELAEGGEVFDKIGKDGPFSEADAADVVRQVASAPASSSWQLASGT